MDKIKKQYFLNHLFTSIIVISLISALCVFYWFPSVFILLDGTWYAILILASIDVIIGPLLTLIVVTSKKSSKELFTDLIVIILIQCSALSYGLYQIYQERIYALVHFDGVFHLVPHKEISNQTTNKALNVDEFGNYIVAMVLNTEIKEHAKHTNIPLLYSPKKYHAVTKIEMTEAPFSYENLPIETQEKYNENYIFKLLLGKKRTAVIIFNSELKIIDIALLPK